MNVQIFPNYFSHHIALGVWCQIHADQVTILLSLSAPYFWQCSRVGLQRNSCSDDYINITSLY